MKFKLATMILLVSSVFASDLLVGFAQENSANRNKSVKSEMKQSGKEGKEAGAALGHNVKHGRVARGGKHFGKHIYRSGKHFGKGTGRAAKKTGSAVKKVVKP